MKQHWKVVIAMVLAAGLGLAMPFFVPGGPHAGLALAAVPGEAHLQVTAVETGGPAAQAKIAKGATLDRLVRNAGSRDPDRPEESIDLESPAAYDEALAKSSNGDIIRLFSTTGQEHIITLTLDPKSRLSLWIEPFQIVADIFMALLKMLVVPIVLTSIIAGVAGVGAFGDLRRLGWKTFAWYMSTSLLAIVVGQVLVSVVAPGGDAQLGLRQIESEEFVTDDGIFDVLKRMVPSNVVQSFSNNGAMLQIIFFALLFGYFLTQTAEPHRTRAKELFESLFQVMLRMAEGIMTLLPYGVFCLVFRVTAKTGLSVFKPLLLFMVVVTAALLVHALVTLPILLKIFGGLSPRRWMNAMSPVLVTAFSTSSSSVTLPVTMKTVKERGRVSNRVTSFTLPLGSTINMDGTALYECIGVVFLAQYYASTGAFDFTIGKQVLVVVMALLASVGAAGIPSAGLVMMLSILAALGLPLEGAALLLAIDRPLDMMRTVVNVWSDTCGAAVIARSEGETALLEAGVDTPPASSA